MTFYKITQRGTDLKLTVLADSYEQAAAKAAWKLYGRGVVAVRTTGTDGLSGWYRAYRTTTGSTYSSVGQPFHVM